MLTMLVLTTLCARTWWLVLQISDGAAVVGTSERCPLGGAILHAYLGHALKSRGINLSRDHVQKLKEMCSEVADSQESYLELLTARKTPPSNGTGNPAQEETADNAAAATPTGGPTKHVLPDGQEVTIEVEGCANPDLPPAD